MLSSTDSLQGPQACSHDGCNALWSPDKEEQCFCWNCKNWFNLTCLDNPTSDQEYYLQKMKEQYHSVPKIIVQVAFQPTARGGETHFVAGNIRLVSSARLLLDPEARDRVASEGWMIAYKLEQDMKMEGGDDIDGDDEWQAYLEFMHNIDDKQRRNPMEEQLSLDGQEMYTCPICLGDHQL